MASIRDVAKEAGVAVCTVSRVINGTANVAEETQKKIEEAMKKLNYIPNELARSMFKKRSNTIAMLVPNIQHPWFSSLASEIEKQLYARDYKLMLCSTGGNEKRERECFHMLKSNIVDGIICGTMGLDAKEYEEVDKPLIMLDYKVNDKIPVVVSDHTQGARMAANEFINSGCKYVLHICSKDKEKEVISYKSHEKLEEYLHEAGIESRAVSIQWNDFDFDGYFELAKCILQEYPQIDGVMAADLPAMAFLKAAMALGKKVPDEMSIVAYDGTFVVRTNSMPVTTICQPYHEIGENAVKLVLAMLENKENENAKELPSELIYNVSFEKGMTTK